MLVTRRRRWRRNRRNQWAPIDFSRRRCKWNWWRARQINSHVAYGLIHTYARRHVQREPYETSISMSTRRGIIGDWTHRLTQEAVNKFTKLKCEAAARGPPRTPYSAPELMEEPWTQHSAEAKEVVAADNDEGQVPWYFCAGDI